MTLMKTMKAALLTLPVLLAACAPAATGTTTTAYAPDAPVKPGDTWKVSGTTPNGTKFSSSIKLANVTPRRSERGTYTYQGVDGFVQWRDNGFMWVYTTDTNPEQDDTCITYDARPSTNGPYSAYALVGSTAEIDALFSKLGNSDNPYGVLGSANACTITKQ